MTDRQLIQDVYSLLKTRFWTLGAGASLALALTALARMGTLALSQTARALPLTLAANFFGTFAGVLALLGFVDLCRRAARGLPVWQPGVLAAPGAYGLALAVSGFSVLAQAVFALLAAVVVLGIQRYPTPDIIFPLLTLSLAALAFCAAARLSAVFFLLCEDPPGGAKNALRASWRVMKGHIRALPGFLLRLLSRFLGVAFVFWLLAVLAFSGAPGARPAQALFSLRYVFLAAFFASSVPAAAAAGVGYIRWCARLAAESAPASPAPTPESAGEPAE